jgi:3-hydroxyisobutyrate dehydrogenase-like beta-hydroxyacid dehydrogenase
MAPRVGFIGFGEAASAIAKGLKAEGVAEIAAFDKAAIAPAAAPRFRARADGAGVALVESLKALAERSEIVISAVVAAAALPVANEIAPHLGARHFYMDMNSTSPQVKQEIEQALGPSGARFVEAAVMDAVPPFGHRVPMLLCGKEAATLAETLSRYGMRLEVLGERIGPASATKMFRSIMIKGIEALFIESALAADRYGAAERVFASLTESYPGIDWNEFASSLMRRTALHAERRAHEMEEVAATLEAIGEEPIMSLAAAKRLMSTGPGALKARFADKPPAHYRDVVAAVREARKK